ncbi:MAG TPA: M48 family metallopeptidase [Nitrolancea sp.]|nr:M48 family metallopeptidase [Nitrolancea sp.]
MSARMVVFGAAWLVARAALTAEAAEMPEKGAGERERARRYNHAKHVLLTLDLALSLVGGAALVLSGLPGDVRRRVFARASNRLAGRTAVIAVFTLGQFIVSLPLGYYSGYLLEHRFDLSNQSRRGWLWEQVKGLLISLPLVAVLGNGLLWVIGRWPRRWWLVVSALSLPFTVLFAQLGPVLIMPLFNKFEPLRDQQLAERLKALAARSGIHVAQVLEMNMSKQTKKANAFFAGLGGTRRIVLGDTLVEDFSPEEIEVVVAHEIAHQAHHDIWRLIAVGTVGTAASTFAVERIARWALERFPRRLHLHSLDDVAALPLLGIISGLVGLVLMPLANAYSRHLERRADGFALDLTRTPRAFIGSMRQLAEQNLADPNPSALVKYLLYSHPPIEQRVAHAEEWARRHEQHDAA